MFQITIIMYRIIQVTLIYRDRNENLVSDTTKGLTIQMRLYIRYKCLSFDGYGTYHWKESI